MPKGRKRKACAQHTGSSNRRSSTSAKKARLLLAARTEKEDDHTPQASQMSTALSTEGDRKELVSGERRLRVSASLKSGIHSPDLLASPHLRIPPDVELFYRTPGSLRYGYRNRIQRDTTDYFNKFSIPSAVILNVFSYLNKKDLMMTIFTCRKFRQIGYDSALWQRMNLGEGSVTESEVHSLMDRGIRVLRLARATITEDLDPQLDPRLLQPRAHLSKLTHLDLSGAAPGNPSLIAQILERCTKLQGVSLEQRCVDDRVCTALSRNADIRYLDLTMCQGISPEGLKSVLQGCRRLLELNLAWTDVDVEHVAALAKLPRCLRRLNLSGITQPDRITDEDVMQITMHCPNLVELDLCDAPSITERSLKAVLYNLQYLQDMSISRCYGIEPTALLLAEGLRSLNVFGNITAEGIRILQDHLGRVKVNSSPFSTVAAPTSGEHVSSIWLQTTVDLY